MIKELIIIAQKKILYFMDSFLHIYLENGMCMLVSDIWVFWLFFFVISSHSKQQREEKMLVTILPSYQDNYFYGVVPIATVAKDDHDTISCFSAVGEKLLKEAIFSTSLLLHSISEKAAVLFYMRGFKLIYI